jgi:hypothetical protein
MVLLQTVGMEAHPTFLKQVTKMVIHTTSIAVFMAVMEEINRLEVGLHPMVHTQTHRVFHF